VRARVPAAPPLLEEIMAAAAQRLQLAHRRYRTAEEMTRADEEDEDEQPDADDRLTRGGGAKRRRQLAARRGERDHAFVVATELPAEVHPESGAAPHLESVHVGVARLAVRGNGLASAMDAREPAEVPGPRRRKLACVTEASVRERVDDLDQREHEGLRQDACKPTDAPAREHRTIRVAELQAAGVVEHATVGQSFTVASHGVGHDHHAGSGELRAPAQVDVVTPEPHLGIEPAEGSEQVGAHENARAGHREDVGDGVALRLVDLAFVGERRRRSELVHREADVLQPCRIVPHDELRCDDRRVRADHLVDEVRDRIRG
jgi:hypothetical protein